MPRFCHLQVYQVHIADGFSSDCEELVQKCLELKTVDFYEFSKIWKAMHFDTLYQGRLSSAEIAELSEELVHIAKHYMVKNTSYFEESVTGLFLVYSLLSLQPFSGFACLRLTPKDVRAVNRIEMVARQERRLDILYILGEVLIKWTEYHATERPRGMEMVVRKYLEAGYISIDKSGMRPMGVFYRQNEALDLLRDLTVSLRQYALARAEVFSNSPDPSSLQYISTDITNDMNKQLRKLTLGSFEEIMKKPPRYDDSSSGDENKTSEERSKKLYSIKEKAMTNAVDPMNHLTSGQDRKIPRKSLKGKSDLKSPTGNIKSSSHTKLVMSSSIDKPLKKSKGTPISDSDNDNVHDNDENADLNIEGFIQISDENDKIIQIPEEPDLPAQPGLKLKFDSLPSILKPGDLGQDIEIEIIDNINNENQNKNTETAGGSSSNDDEPLSVRAGTSVLKTYKRERKDELPEETVFPIKKKEKREQKRRELKSKFKKMGMLPFANFED